MSAEIKTQPITPVTPLADSERLLSQAIIFFRKAPTTVEIEKVAYGAVNPMKFRSLQYYWMMVDLLPANKDTVTVGKVIKSEKTMIVPAIYQGQAELKVRNLAVLKQALLKFLLQADQGLGTPFNLISDAFESLVVLPRKTQLNPNLEIATRALTLEEMESLGDTQLNVPIPKWFAA